MKQSQPQSLAVPLKPQSLGLVFKAEYEKGASIDALAEDYGITYEAALAVLGGGVATHSSRPKNLIDYIPMLKRVAYWAFDVSRDAIEKAGLRDRAIFGGTAMDKVLLLENKPTSITGHLHLHRHALTNLSESLMAALEAKQSIIIEAHPETPPPPSD